MKLKQQKQPSTPAPENNAELAKLRNAVADVAVEMLRFERSFTRMVRKAPPADAQRCISEYEFFRKKLDESLAAGGMTLVDYTGQRYEIGMAASAVNLDEFDENEELYVKTMLEPIVMADGKVFRTGKMMLGGADE